MSKSDQDNKIETEDLTVDSLDDASRRALLSKLARVGAAAVPASVVMLDAKKASAAGSSPEFGGF